jgi:polygalacturonase
MAIQSRFPILSTLCLLLNAGLLGQQMFDVKEFGAVGNAQVNDTSSIQKAIDAAGSKGSGTVYFPAGRYLAGTLLLKSGVTLYLENGAVLMGSSSLDDFPITRPSVRSYTDNYVNRSLIYGENLRDIAIIGRGAIDGQGAAFTDPSYMVRPYLIRLVRCRNVLVEGITMRDSPMWVQHYLGCDFVRIEGLFVHSQVNRNNDMIDIDGCHNVIVSNCFADTEDDAITLKSTFARATENVAVTNCVLSSQCNAIKLGTESNGGFKNISISNCVIDSSYANKPGYLDREKGNSGISLLMVDGGGLENITIDNIVMTGVQVPIFVRLGNRARPFKKDMAQPGMGYLRDVVISNLTARDVGPLGSSITGLPGSEVENVTLSNVRIAYPGGGSAEDAARSVPELEGEYPAARMFGILPAWGLYCRHVKGLRLSRVDLQLENHDERPAMVFEDVRRLDVVEVSSVRVKSSTAPMLLMKDVEEALVGNCRVSPFQGLFLRLEGNCRKISTAGNHLFQTQSQIELGEGVPQDALLRDQYEQHK